ncbi:hypothetical protein NEPAR06_0485 [Nematocida parisii]|uniref:Uncharacterized protein n=1 Tax=Nematocida parisii (strain ERTm3) TaxID=935791 RepID=I3EJH1_NEMP3|nr:uncharacterized protein NEPG_01101 [Nematocida parisii ERTm1]EIJ89368.1 hypothetical protein NEQG_00138 [Nematocida parisii ERTm3]KAI5127429.1 hypothetical protein NEPAR08_0870 [Nematocida parisii]EIJ94433.1 hypothetical protein NEPG_01101 [Nematocida parisii ERTm1]KAI5129054.1 hypothetical protein NEPAR03_1500 [Nematocida parisii]KAI5141328.1 hypothetical protein NEPAR04_0890 [Nematocida parisii]|eukprot:XP_013058929.1 hypothetical protein NEPG_01101 [Nematocida parisii ERTm1]
MRQEETPASILSEIKKEVLTNAVYYIDSKYHEITKRNQLKRDKHRKAQNALESVNNELNMVIKRIKEADVEINKLKERMSVERVEGTIDLKLLLERIVENSNNLHSQKIITPSFYNHNVIYSVNFVNAEMCSITQNKIDILDRVKNSYR